MSANKLLVAAFVASVLATAPSFAQQAGGIRGKVSVEAAGGSPSGITVTAESEVMPKARSATVRPDGTYALPLLLPGKYTLTFSNALGVLQKVDVEVLLDQTSVADVSIAATRPEELQIVRIVATGLSREGNASLANSLGARQVESLPVGQEYRDLLKLIPGVQYSENTRLGPSAGGSGVDNKYGFDGVDVSLPLFGNLAADPSTHDVENVAMERGGAKAIGFNRSGGFSINTTSKSGTNDFKGSVEYKFQPKNLVADIRGTVPYTLERSWITAGFGGPIIEDSLFFYASYYRPEDSRVNPVTRYGNVKDFNSIRDEYFGKLTWAPTEDLLFNASLRTSDRQSKGAAVGALDADSVSTGDLSKQDILTIDGSWLLGEDSSLSFKYGKFELITAGTPDNLLSVIPAINGRLDVANLANMGAFTVPLLRTAVPTGFTAAQLAAYNAGAQTLINQYGYDGTGGVKTGGGTVGAFSQINNQNFFRDSGEIAFATKFDIGSWRHALHIGLKYQEISEDLSRVSNGWGAIRYAGGLERTTTLGANNVPFFYEAATEQQTLRDAAGNPTPGIVSESTSYNIEINDTITIGDFDLNLGVMLSEDVLYGQGLRKNANNISGFEKALGEKYEMYRIGFGEMIQPRLGLLWRYNGSDTMFANFAQYNPEASSLARAASWDRNLRAQLRMRFDQNGNLLEVTPRAGSSGKLFADGLKPRRIDEFTVGTTKSLENGLSLRGHLRYREGSHFWEDFANNARLLTYTVNGVANAGGAPADVRAKGLYIPGLAAMLPELGSTANPNSAFVIAEVDGGFTKYYEASLEAEWQGDRTYLNASYTWSRYRGNFDQDNTAGNNDLDIFIGSSNYGDDPGKFPWDNRGNGVLSGDRPHVLKMYGFYTTDWKANIGAFFVFQSGQPWEKWSNAYYGSTSTSTGVAASRFAEPAGSRRSPNHWQIDLNYTQNFQWGSLPTLKFRADLFNVTDRQTGYRFQPYDFAADFGQARSTFLPRRLQFSVRMDF